MTDIATLGLEIRSDGVVVASDRLKKLTEESGKADSANAKLGGTFDTLAKYIKMAAVALGAYKLATYIKEAVELAARVETLSAVMRVVGNNAGYTGKQMEGFTAQVKAMGITTQESMSSLIKMASAQLDLSKASALARVAQDAAVIGGINSSEAFGRMINGIRSGEVEILKTIGINVQFEQGYKVMAASMGKTTEQLTANEKAQARLNQVIDYGKNIQGAYEASLSTAGKQMLSMARYTEDLKLAIGNVALPVFTSMIWEVVAGLKAADTWVKENKKELKEFGETLSTWWGATKNVLLMLANTLDRVGKAAARMWQFLLIPAALSGNQWAKDQIEGAQQYIKMMDARIDANHITQKAIMAARNADTSGPLLDPSEMGRFKTGTDPAEVDRMKRSAEAREAAAKADLALQAKKDAEDELKYVDQRDAAVTHAWNAQQSHLRETAYWLNEQERGVTKIEEAYKKQVNALKESDANYKSQLETYKFMRTQSLERLNAELELKKVLQDQKVAIKELEEVTKGMTVNAPLLGAMMNMPKMGGDVNLGIPGINGQEFKPAVKPKLSVMNSTGPFIPVQPDDPYYDNYIKNKAIETKRAGGDFYGAQSDTISKQWEDEKKAIELHYGDEIAMHQRKLDEMAAADALYAAQKKALDEESAKVALSSLGNSLSSLGATMMKGNKAQFEAGKKMAIAGATVQMMLGAVNAFTAMSSIPYVGPALGALAAAAVVAQGTQNIAMISAQKYEGRELGGPVTANQPYIVGEKRAEVFVPNQSGRIIPKTGGDQQISVTPVFQMSMGVTATVQAEVMRMAPAIIDMSVKAVRSALRQGQLQEA